MGIVFIFLYNFYAYLLRSVGNSIVPLYFLAVSSVLNVVLDLYFVISIKRERRSSGAIRNFTRNCLGMAVCFFCMDFTEGLGVQKCLLYDCHFSWNKSCISLCLCTDYRRNSNLVGNSYRMASGGYGGTDILQKCLPIIY